MAQAWEYSVVMIRLRTCYWYETRAVCPSALLRVPRPSASSLTSAEHPGKPLFGLYLYLRKTFCLATGVACLPQRSQGGGRRTGDMSGGGYAVPVADLEKKNQITLSSNYLLNVLN